MKLVENSADTLFSVRSARVNFNFSDCKTKKRYLLLFLLCSKSKWRIGPEIEFDILIKSDLLPRFWRYPRPEEGRNSNSLVKIIIKFQNKKVDEGRPKKITNKNRIVAVSCSFVLMDYIIFGAKLAKRRRNKNVNLSSWSR